MCNSRNTDPSYVVRHTYEYHYGETLNAGDRHKASSRTANCIVQETLIIFIVLFSDCSLIQEPIVTMLRCFFLEQAFIFIYRRPDKHCYSQHYICSNYMKVVRFLLYAR